MLYLRRDDWPEQDFLIDWLKINARCVEIGETALERGQLQVALNALWLQSAPAAPLPTGAEEAARLISALL